MQKKARTSARRAKQRVLSNQSRRAGAILLVLALAGLIVWQHSGRRSNVFSTNQTRPLNWDRRHYDGQLASVVRVVDGDTLDIDIADVGHATTRIRLWGVDTPETKHPKWGRMYFGPEASQFAKDLALGQTVKVVLEPFEKSRDKYGRLLAYVFLPDGSMLNEQLLIQGMAYADERFEHVYRSRFLQHQKQAQKEKRGLWKSVRPEQWPQWRRRRHDPDYRP